MRPRVLASVAVSVVVVAVAGVAVGVGVSRDAGTGPATSGSPDPASVPPPAELALPDARPAVPVLAGPTDPRLDPAAVRQRLSGLLSDPDLGGHVGVLVRDLDRGRDLLRVGGAATFTPASTLKLFTTAAVLRRLGPDHRFTTTVVLDLRGPGPPRAVLVGGGDPLLARTAHDPSPAYAPDVSRLATVRQLAARTGRALRAAGIERVRVGWDASLFSGPAVSPQWPATYVPEEVVTPVSALWVDEGRLGFGYAARSPDPAAAAAHQLAADLEGDGIAVSGTAVSAPQPGEHVLASVRSAPLDEIVQHVLVESDNEGAEVLLRQVGLAAGRPGSFTGGTAAVRATLRPLGVPWAGVRSYDGSGLSRDDGVTLDAELAVLGIGADPAEPDLRTVTAGLPVARFSGSLAYRFVDPEAAAGRGVVRAKTGTLTGVHALTGTVVTRDGALLGFAMLLDRVRPQDTLDARDTLDRLAAALAGCGCAR